ncbi:uncharacterized protein LOC125702693 isoform X2 [Lagopus muta]|uniref:uncharacterized protein LOC125702693 isoform X2 n=1 Tax=Lagopus muta TaxID=64668 RepID=UPI00209FB45B|nr:uncharacterized protein LOC125702693 isoform X2 [Lagopus muta]XP_048822262.1 uncharacterized protein LOC125702693 isoform X2 [Lagopus muta]
MAAEVRFSPPEVPEPTLMENVLRSGLLFGAVLQLVCVWAITLPVPKCPETTVEEQSVSGCAVALGLRRTVCDCVSSIVRGRWQTVEEQSVSGCAVALGLRRTVCDCVSSIVRGRWQKAASWRAAEQQAVCAMAAEVRFSPPEVPEPTLMENVLRSGLLFGAVFQLVCVWAITLPVPKCPETSVEEQSVSGCAVALGLRRTVCDCVSSSVRGRWQKAASWRAAEQQAVCAMAAEVRFSPPEVPEPTLMENVLRSGLLFGAVFQLVCVWAITLPVPKCPETTVEEQSVSGCAVALGLRRTVCDCVSSIVRGRWQTVEEQSVSGCAVALGLRRTVCDCVSSIVRGRWQTVEEQSVSGCAVALGLRRTVCDCVSSIVRGRWQKAASWRAAEQQAVCAMAAEVRFSPPEVPEPTLMENVLRSGLLFGAVFQLVCVWAITLPVPKCPETSVEEQSVSGCAVALGLRRTVCDCVSSSVRGRWQTVEEQSVSGCAVALGLRRTVCDCVSSIVRGRWQKAASWRAAEQQAVCAMAAEVRFSPPEVPEPTLMENVLRSGLLFGAVFQLVCVWAITLPVAKCPETTVEEQSVSGCAVALGLRRTVCECVSSIVRGRWQKAASWRAAEQQAVCAMAAEVRFSPPEVPEPTLMENVLRSGLLFGAVFQLVCVWAITLPVAKCPETTVEEQSVSGCAVALGLRRTVCECVSSIVRGRCQKAASWRAAEQQAVCAMAAEVRFSPPEVPEPTLMENVLRSGLLFGAVFQLVCVWAITLPVAKCPETTVEEQSVSGCAVALGLRRTVCECVSSIVRGRCQTVEEQSVSGCAVALGLRRTVCECVSSIVRGRCQKAASWRAAEQQAVCAMAAEVRFSPPEVPEPTLMENVLRSGLFFGAVFQLVCVWAITLPVPKCPETNIEACEWLRNGVGAQGSNGAMGACVTTFLSGPCKDWHSLGTRSGETVKKAKARAALLRKKAQKESKKNRAGLEREGPQDTRVSWNASSEVAPKAAD